MDEAHHRQLPSNKPRRASTPHMAVFATVIVAAGNRYQRVRTVETNSAVVAARGDVAVLLRKEPAKFTAIVNDNVYIYIV